MQSARPTTRPTTRLAPSPTGALHLGNARSFLICWAMARASGWRIILRIEDLDGPRIKPGAIESCINTLSWLGMDWDDAPLIQSTDLTPYIDAMHLLASRALTYPSELSRTQIELAASAPQEGAHDQHFPSSLRPPLIPHEFDPANTSVGWRFATSSGPVTFTDLCAGHQSIDPAQTIGDFVIWTKRAQPAYQLAVVVDDARQGITHIIRGNDLLDSAARQLLLYRALHLTSEPTYCHLPLVRGSDGKRLAKRHGDTRIDTYRALGVPAEAIIGLIALWSGVLPHRQSLSAAEFSSGFNISTLPPSDITFTAEDHAWLLSNIRK
ncbi:MAG: tRNA glutamyl-Q(34) synthetase GluQRS [Planctomycetes bacterium]|nr:tRNA glutamyl-Q(34) synthetase GluQRS [Planctomycetota bacterium]